MRTATGFPRRFNHPCDPGQWNARRFKELLQAGLVASLSGIMIGQPWTIQQAGVMITSRNRRPHLRLCHGIIISCVWLSIMASPHTCRRHYSEVTRKLYERKDGPLLDCAYNRVFQDRLLEIALRNGANPNEQSDGSSLWQYALPNPLQDFVKWIAILGLFILRGADPDAYVERHEEQISSHGVCYICKQSNRATTTWKNLSSSVKDWQKMYRSMEITDSERCCQPLMDTQQ